MLDGVDVREVLEHPWLTFLKPGEVILIRDRWQAEPPFAMAPAGDSGQPNRRLL